MKGISCQELWLHEIWSISFSFLSNYRKQVKSKKLSEVSPHLLLLDPWRLKTTDIHNIQDNNLGKEIYDNYQNPSLIMADILSSYRQDIWYVMMIIKKQFSFYFQFDAQHNLYPYSWRRWNSCPLLAIVAMLLSFWQLIWKHKKKWFSVVGVRCYLL